MIIRLFYKKKLRKLYHYNFITIIYLKKQTLLCNIFIDCKVFTAYHCTELTEVEV